MTCIVDLGLDRALLAKRLGSKIKRMMLAQRTIHNPELSRQYSAVAEAYQSILDEMEAGDFDTVIPPDPKGRDYL